MNKKEFYKHIKLAIVLSVERFYTGIDFDGYEKVMDTTIRSLFNEYKSEYPFKDEK